MIRGTVGVAPGSYTLQLGGLPNCMVDPSCPPDGIGTGSYGVPVVGWYDLPNNWCGYDPNAPEVQPAPGTPGGVAPPVGGAAPLDPYGTDSTLNGLQGLGLTSTATGALTVVGLFALAGVLFTVLKPKRRRR